MLRHVGLLSGMPPQSWPCPPARGPWFNHQPPPLRALVHRMCEHTWQGPARVPVVAGLPLCEGALRKCMHACG